MGADSHFPVGWRRQGLFFFFLHTAIKTMIKTPPQTDITENLTNPIFFQCLIDLKRNIISNQGSFDLTDTRRQIFLRNSSTQKCDSPQNVPFPVYFHWPCAFATSITVIGWITKDK